MSVNTLHGPLVRITVGKDSIGQDMIRLVNMEIWGSRYQGYRYVSRKDQKSVIYRYGKYKSRLIAEFYEYRSLSRKIAIFADLYILSCP